MTTLSGSPLSTCPKRSLPRCRELKRHLDRFRDQLEKRGIRLDEVIGTEQFYCIHRVPERDGNASSQAPAGCVEEGAGPYGPERWKGDPDKLITTIEKGFDKVGINLAALAAENDSLKRGLADQVSAIGLEVDPEYFQWILTILATGSIRAAAQALGIRKSTLAERLKRYAARGGTYAFLYGLVSVRRRVLGTRRLEHYNEDYLPHQRPGCGHYEEALLRDLLNALEAQNEKNWPQVRQELLDLLAEHVE